MVSSLVPEIPTRGAEVVTRDGRSLPLVSARLHADARGGIARMVLEQRFENRYAETLHVTYRMPLPAGGAVSGYAFQIAGRTIVLVDTSGSMSGGPLAKAKQVVAMLIESLGEGDRLELLSSNSGALETPLERPCRSAGLTDQLTLAQMM